MERISSRRAVIAAVATFGLLTSALTVGTAVAAPATTTPERAFAKHLQVVDAGLLSGGRDTSALSAWVPAAADLGPELTAQAQQLAVYERSKAVDFGAWAARHGDTYRSVKSAPTTRSVKVTGTRATILADVVTTLLWSSTAKPNVNIDPGKALDMQKATRKGLAFGPGNVVTSMVSAQHTVTLVLVDGSWEVVNDSYLDPFANDLAADHATPRSVGPDRSSNSSVASPALPAASASGSKASASAVPGVAASYTRTYNRDRARAYADKYWKVYNTSYPNCNPSGGDCANFVSQALWDPAIGADLPSVSPYWTWNGGSTCGSTSEAWRYTPTMHNFFVANPRGATYNFAKLGASGSWSATNAYNKASMMIGDVIFYDWATANGVKDHVVIATAYVSDGTTLVNAHNTNRYHVRYDFGTSYNNGTNYYMDQFKTTITFY